ncbi:MAG: hypothetical protein Q8K70_03325 [Bacteroidota bacterium]|nr:hypothetical protein [Bacteroidota bacterium]
MNQGVVEMENQNYEGALVFFNKSIEKNDGYALCYYNRAIAYINLRDTFNFEKDINTCVDLEPDNADFLIQKALVYYFKQDYDEAIVWGKKSADIKLNNILVAMILGDCYFFKRNLNEADYYYNIAYNLADNKCEITGQIALVKLSINDFDNAKKLFNSCKNTEYDNDEYKVKESHLYLKLNNYNKLESLLVLIDTNKLNDELLFMYYFHYGIVEMQKEKYNSSISYFKKSKEIVPTELQVDYNIALCYARDKNPEEAISWLINSANNDSSYFLLADQFIKLDDFENGLKNLKKIKSIQFKNEIYYTNKAICNFNLGNIEDAVEDIETAYLKNPKSDFVIVNKIRICLKNLPQKTAFELIDTGLNINPNNLGLISFKVLQLVDTKKYSEAREYLKNLYTLTNDTFYYYSMISRVYAEENKMNLHKEFMIKAYQLNPKDNDVFSDLLAIYRYENNYQKCIELLNFNLTHTNKRIGKKHNSLAEFYIKLKNFKNACYHFNLAEQNGYSVDYDLKKEIGCK